jgi:GAF domain-containing protein
MAMQASSEQERIQHLQETGILDTPDDRLFRGFAEQALGLLPGSSVAAVSLIDTDRQWFKTIVGLDTKETSREVSFCTHTIETPGVMVVEDATQDSRFAANPLVITSPKIRFYVGIRLVNGVGAFCVMGPTPRHVTDVEIAKLTKLAHCVDIQLLAHGSLFNLGASTRKVGPR